MVASGKRHTWGCEEKAVRGAPANGAEGEEGEGPVWLMANGMVWLMLWPVKHSHMQIFALQSTTVSNVTQMPLSISCSRSPRLSLAHQIEKAQRAQMEASLPAGTRTSDGILEPSRILLAHRYLFPVQCSAMRVCAVCAWGVRTRAYQKIKRDFTTKPKITLGTGIVKRMLT